MADRKEYPLSLNLNGRNLNRLIIDQYYSEKHPDVNDQIIISLVQSLNGENHPIDMVKEGFQYFTVEPVYYDEKPYRIILVMYIYEDYLGVVNAFRVNRR